MIDRQSTRFWRAALQSRLVDAAQLERCWEEIPPDRRTPDAIDRRLARRVVDHGLMTRWQAQQLLAGLRPQSLWFDRYLVEELIGQGGMGRVYLARDNRLGRRVALKVLSRERMNNPRAITRFRREAKVGAQLQHENLVRIYDEGEVNGNFYLVMEYLQGKTAGRLIAERGPLPADIAARVARGVALGLEHAHRKGLVHRDVNPMNILIDRDGTAKLTDLGLAIDLADQGDAVTRDGATVGTFDYISPEQARHSRSIDIRSDLYSLGCALYHMIAGRPPYTQPSLAEKLYAHQSLPAVPLEAIVPGLAPGLARVVYRLMAKRPEDRYATPLEAARALEPFQSGPVTLADIESAPEVPIWIEPGTTTDSGSRSTSSGAGAGRAAAAAPTAIGSDDLFGALPKIDTGPEPPRSGTVSGVADEVAREPHDLVRRLRVPAIAAAVLLAGAALWLWPRSETQSSPGPDRRAGPVDGASTGATKPAPEPLPAIAVRWLDDGTETPHGSLHEAIRYVAGKDAEVILRDDAPIALASARPVVISGGAVVIRAAEGARPVLRADLATPAAPIMVRLDGALKLSGLTFEGGTTPANPGGTLIQSAGNLALERCSFLAPPTAPAATAVRADGRRSTFLGCEFRGFDAPLKLNVFAGSEARVAHCLFVRRAGPDPASSWALTVSNLRIRDDKAPRSLAIDHCTVLGSGLLSMADFVPETPLRVEVEATVVEGPALVGWRGTAPFPGGMAWRGRDNRYAIAGGPWVRCTAPGAEVAGPPTDLASWSRAAPEEPGTLSMPAIASGRSGPPLESRPAADLAGPAPGLGMDPTRVGP
jgi:serine/threonine protein kinase